MSKLVFTPSKLCFSAGDEVMLKAFKKQLHTYLQGGKLRRRSPAFARLRL